MAPNILNNILLTVNCSDYLSAEFIGYTSVWYNKTGKHIYVANTSTDVNCAVCWNIEPRDRPTFVDIILQLEEIGNSAFITTSHASFRSLQQTWRIEIEQCFEELRSKDDVRIGSVPLTM